MTHSQRNLGDAPLYRWNRGAEFVYSDSVRDLLAKGAPRKLSVAGLRSYLEYGCVCEPLTLIEGVEAVPPRLARSDARFESADDAQKAVTAAVEDSIRRALAPDGAGRLPAALLSGGIDSSAVVAVMRRIAPDAEIRTYCVTHEDAMTDEREWARKVAEANGTKHVELMLTGDMIHDSIEEAIACYDQPSVDGLNFWFVSKLLSERGESTVLSGEGADELFVGYWRFRNQRNCERWARRLGWLPSCLGVPFMKWGPNDKVRKFGQLVGCKTDPYFESRRVFDRLAIGRLLRPELREPVAAAEPFSRTWQRTFGQDMPKDDWVNATSWKELTTVLLSMYLHDGHQTSRPFGLDIRAPLIDPKLAALVLAVPGGWKCSPECLKPLLVKAAGKGLPRACVVRKKQGFTLPFDRYFNGVMKERIDAFLFGGDTLLFDRSALEGVGRLYREGKTTWSRVWTLFMADDWCRRNRIEFGGAVC